MRLPVLYDNLTPLEKKEVREHYIVIQEGNCFWCKEPLSYPPPQRILSKRVNWRLFPPNFTKYPVHLQHCHQSGLTEGAVHAYCNAVMWQYHGR